MLILRSAKQIQTHQSVRQGTQIPQTEAVYRAGHYAADLVLKGVDNSNMNQLDRTVNICIKWKSAEANEK